MKYLLLIAGLSLVAISGCDNAAKHASGTASRYEKLLAKAAALPPEQLNMQDNLFDDSLYDPAVADVNRLFDTLQDMFLSDSLALQELSKTAVRMEEAGIGGLYDDAISSAGNEEHIGSNNTSTYALAALAFNLDQLRSSPDTANDSTTNNLCRQVSCKVWAKISLSTQQLSLYVDGQLVDTLPVSTGIKRYETPLMEVRPSGPMLQKYSSRKFPGGNYMGMGNMPYTIFIKGGYAIHGTTQGNIAKLGRKASHGCIRLHPEKALVFFELIKQAGLENTWISVQP